MSLAQYISVYPFFVFIMLFFVILLVVIHKQHIAKMSPEELTIT